MPIASTALYVERVFQRVSSGNPQAEVKVYRWAIQATVEDALQELARSVCRTGKHHLLENVYSLTISGSSADFSASTDLLPESIKLCNDIQHASVAQAFEIKDSVGDLNFENAISDSILGYAAVGDTKVYFKHPPGALTGSLLVRAVKIPTLANIPEPLEGELINIGAQLAIAKVLEAQEK